ncbi:PREDICTED: tetratricopeptide repeat protein 28 [Drosophila arizonae]|uniref:Tetratricopeptide repeat protein 28 n=1 Tax=Drosophila arizonae TaxID=7263 RepID=A0ABM1PW23_DROAR|nr:PREDICTED: tetratricopeptide repeat protein 28 [Drosophila arizonae]XP_017871409.1 PREDICTED: tetratricopeptide repeat protein 28 [Drosophila arizonae]XP_017871410.1 PREDICTED: tetratricopeptide repeat protein 28 [Drosophila arizonae]
MTNYENLINLPLNFNANNHANNNENNGKVAVGEQLLNKMSQRDFSENEPECTPELPAANRALFLEKVRQSNAACQSGDFATAVLLYTDALQLDPGNHILYSNRSAARLKQGQFAAALQDATQARELCPQWPKAYFRQGVALQCLGRYGEALASFAAGLAQEPTNKQLLAGLVEASLKSPLRAALEPTLQQLRAMQLHESPFVVSSVVGQELLQASQYQAAVAVLEAALRIGSCSLKLRGSVFSALSSAHWALNQLDQAIGYMQQDLAVAKSLGDTAGECRAHGNLGSAYFSQGAYKEALTAHRYQLVLAMKCKDTQAAASALTSLGHVYTASGDYPNALASHKQCVQLFKQLGDRLQEAREIGNVGAVYLALGECEAALDCHTQHLRLARKLHDQVEEARAYSNLGSAHHQRRQFGQAAACHEQVLRIAQALGDRSIEARAYAGLGHAARCAGDAAASKRWHERQLAMALAARDKLGEGRACSNLGIVYQLLGAHDAALKLHQAHLGIARALGDRAGMGRAYGNMGNAHAAAGAYEAAVKYHKQELAISQAVNDRSAEAATHGNLAVAYQALGAHDAALAHYRAHLATARSLKDAAGEACALLNLGNCLSARQMYAEAVPHYESYLMLAQELGDVAAEGKACHLLGYAHYCLGNYRAAVRYYDQDLALAKDAQHRPHMGRAYCNLGLAHLALGHTAAALECQQLFLAVAHATGQLPAKFRALGNIGDILIRTGAHEEAIKLYQRQLSLARAAGERAMEAAACGALGLAHRLLRRWDKALGHHTQELTLRQELGDLAGECRAHGHLGAVHMALCSWTHAVKCYQEQLERAQEQRDAAVEAQAHGNLGIARLNMAHYEAAIGCLEAQLGTLERVSLPSTQADRARALGHLGDCYAALGDYEEALKCHERQLQLALGLGSHRDQERAYRGLGQARRALGQLSAALVCLEKRLVVAHELHSAEIKALAYGDLGHVHAALGNHAQALNCLEHQRELARGLQDRALESDAMCALGQVQQRMGHYAEALQLHEQDLQLCTELAAPALQARAVGNLGAVHEALGQQQEALKCYERQLALSTDRLGKALACGALGRVHHQLEQHAQAVEYLRQGLASAQSIGKSEEEAKIRHQLGLALRSSGDAEGARIQLETAAQLLESVRQEQRSPEARLALYELQTSCYHLLQQLLVALQRSEDALVAAERCKARNGADATVGCDGKATGTTANGTADIEAILEAVNRSRMPVLYYSLAGEQLYAWLLQPQAGIVRFHAARIDAQTLQLPLSLSECHEEEEEDEQQPEQQKQQREDEPEPAGQQLLERYVNMVRDNLGVNSQNLLHEGDGSGWRASSEQLLEDLPGAGAGGGGFLRMVSRNQLLNSSNYSLSSLFSLGSVASLQGSTRSVGSRSSRRAPAPPAWRGPACLHTLYNLLLAPFDDLLPSGASVSRQGRRELILVLDSALYLVPFAILRAAGDDGEYLSERCALLTAPSLQALRGRSRSRRDRGRPPTALVVGGPRVPAALAERWGWAAAESPAALQEAAMVADMLQANALAGCNATKESVLAELPSAECVHFAANLSWKLGAVVLSPGDVVTAEQQQQKEPHEPQLSDFTLAASELRHLRLGARLVVLSSYQSVEPITGSGVAQLAGGWLLAGAGAVLISLWPVPETAAKILLRAFYSALLQGARAARALAEAMQTVQHTKHFAHPANWAGFLLVGANVRLSNKVALLGHALCELLRTPERCRDALRVCLHLVEKSLQRIHRGQKNAMYTTQQSIENKAGPVAGWKDLLMAVGFRFEPAANGIPSSVFFPQTDPEERLSQCSASLQALLALTPATLQALAKLVNSAEHADDIIAVVRNILAQFPAKPEAEACIEMPLSVRLWRVAGCHELLASVGFDLTEVGADQVILRTGKQANRRHCQFVLQALLALFDTHEAPKSLSLDSSAHSSSSSCESLAEPELTTPPVQPAASNGNSSTPATATSSTQSPLPLHPRSAFISYVRRRGEPDGGGGLDSSLANTTDSEHSLSDGYATQAGNGQPAPRLGYASLRGPVRVSRPGGGGESDAAFTPSPPVTDPSLSLALAHQTRIRCLYAQPSSVAPSAAPLPNTSRRPDSSSSASSTTTDWEGSGHATVLRRGAAAGAQQQQQQQQLTTQQQQQQPPLPPPRPPVYHNLGAGGRSKPKIKLGSAQSSLAARVNKEHALFMDRLSVRTELNAPAVANGAAGGVGGVAGSGAAVVGGGQRKTLTLTEEEAASVAFNPASLYFSPADSELLGEPKQPMEETPVKPSAKCIQDSIMRHMNRELTPSISELYHERNLGLGLAPPLSKLLLNPNYEEQEVTAMVEANNSSAGNAAAIKTLVDAVNELELSGSSSGATIPTVVGGGVGGGESETNPVSGVVDTERFCSICGEHADVVCRCKAATMQKKSTLKPWLSNVPASSLVQASELTTADILERRLETVAATSAAPFTAELCRRDEGDGRSVADSQCSSNYKRVLATAGAVGLVVGIGAGDAEAQNTTSPATCSAARLV